MIGDMLVNPLKSIFHALQSSCVRFLAQAQTRHFLAQHKFSIFTEKGAWLSLSQMELCLLTKVLLTIKTNLQCDPFGKNYQDLIFVQIR